MRALAAALSVVVLFAVSTAAQAVEIIYFWAADCVHCARFDADELAAYQATPLAKKVRLRKVDVGSYRVRGETVKQQLPPDLAFIKDDPSQVLGGTPRFLVVDRKKVLYNGFGRSVFKRAILPYVQSL